MPFSVLRSVDALRPYRLFDRPVFILAPPRSGSTFLFDMLAASLRIWSWQSETDDVWWRHFPYARLAKPSAHVGAEEYSPAVARNVRRDLYRFTVWSRQAVGRRCGLVGSLGARRVRYVDKTISNCFHVGFLQRAFPDALYVLLLRDGRATVSSMMEGWQDPIRFVNREAQPYLQTPGLTLTHWCYAAPPGWLEWRTRPLAEVCAWSWNQHIDTVRRQWHDIPNERRLVLRYEDILAAPSVIGRRVAAFCGIPWGPEMEEFADKKPLSRTTVSAPEPDKWRRLHGAEIDSILPMIAPLMTSLGYDL